MMEEHLGNKPIKEKQSTRRFGLRLLIPLAASYIVLFVLSLEWSHTLKVQRVIVEGSSIIPTHEIVKLANVKPQASMDNLDLFAIRQHIRKQPFINSVALNRRYPDALCVKITERNPIAAINTGELQYVDGKGVLLPHSPSQAKFDLPLVSGVHRIESAEVGALLINKDIFEAIELLTIAQAIDSSLYHLISEVNMNDGGDIILYAGDSGNPIFFGRGHTEKKLLTLYEFWKNYITSATSENVRYIDLRFEGQVVAKWDQTDGQTTKVEL
ncbi:MAG: FtsQ-type POTRA domain-containing protein [Ignavibacteriae bacterium]|nr:FtsQ-type POTRA domain-containing protein [Ignavibacteriota bacterium]